MRRKSLGNAQETTSVFPSVNLEEWLVAARVASPVRARRTRSGVGERYLYVGDDLKSLREIGEWPLPAFPARLGNRPWRVGQRQDHPDFAVVTEMIREDAANEVDLLLLEWSRSVRQCSLSEATLRPEDRGGLSVACLDDLDFLLSPLKPCTDHGKSIVLALDAGACALPAAALLIAWADRWEGIRDLRAYLGIDPFGTYASGSVLSPESELAYSKDAALYVAKHHSRVVALGVNTGVYHLAGASDVQELALAMATGAAYLQSLLEVGMEVDAACAQLVFTLNADTNFFPQIAKFRAARILWSRIAGAFGASQKGRIMNLQGESAMRFLTRFDPWINIARVATAGSAAVIAGVDGLLLHPFTRALGVAKNDARRIARNSHFLLSEEAILGEVLDAGGRTWSIEVMTHDMADVAWTLLQEITRQGGILAALSSGWVSDCIAEQRAWREREIATGAARIVGINVHPHLDEETPSVCSIDEEYRRKLDVGILAGMDEGRTRIQPGGGESFAKLIEQAGEGASLGKLRGLLATGNARKGTPLPQARESRQWEAVRYAGLSYKARYGNLPGVFFLKGSLGENSRQWIADIGDQLNCAGMSNAGEMELTPEAGDPVEMFLSSGALFAAFLLDGKEGEVSSLWEAAHAVQRVGARGVWLWLRGKNTKGIGEPFSLVIDAGSNLPAAFTDIHESLDKEGM